MGGMKDLLGDVPVAPPPVRLPEYLDGVPREVAGLFERLALELIGMGMRHYSADAILHRIRWHYHVERRQADFKCNNNWTAKLARWFVGKHPAHAGFFELRRSPGEKEDA